METDIKNEMTDYVSKMVDAKEKIISNSNARKKTDKRKNGAVIKSKSEMKDMRNDKNKSSDEAYCTDRFFEISTVKNGFVSDAHTKKRPIANAKKKSIKIAKSEKGPVESANYKKEKNEILENANENKRTIDSNAEEETVDYADLEEKNIDEANAEEEEYLLQKSLHFVYNFEQYLTRSYDIFKRGTSIIDDILIDLPQECKTWLRGSIVRYLKTDNLYILSLIALHENRFEVLKDVLKETLMIKGGAASLSEFLCLSALYVLAAYDLKETGFSEAPQCMNEAMTEAIMSTKQREIINLWYNYE